MKYFWYLLVMALVTYLVRAVPFVVFRNKIKNRFIRSFLYYIPYAVLAAMTIPAIFTSTGNVFSATVGLAAALVMAFFEKGLVTVALTSCAAVFLTELFQRMIF